MRPFPFALMESKFEGIRLRDLPATGAKSRNQAAGIA